MAVIRNGVNSYSESSKDNNMKGSKKINKNIDLLNQKMDSLYKNIYITRPDNKNNLNMLINNLDTAIDQLNTKETSVSGMSELLRRIDNKNSSNVSKLMGSVNDLFSDQNLIGNLFANEDMHNYIAGQNRNFDMICKYLPKLLDALEIKRDNVLCSDNFSKDFINPKSLKSNKLETDKFVSNCKRLELEYDCSKFLEKTYMNTSIYGEDFIYIVPYNIAFERLLKRSNYRKNNARLGSAYYYESASYESLECLKENYTETKDFKSFKESTCVNLSEQEMSDLNKNLKGTKLTLHFNESNIIESSINEYAMFINKRDLEKLQSLNSMHENAHRSLNEASETDLNDMFKDVKFNNDKLSVTANDGLILPDSLSRDPDKIDKNMNGAVVERLPRENILPIYIGKKCLGYYYFEFEEDKNACGFCGGTHSTPGISNAGKMAHDMNENQQELLVKYIASKISSAIDTRFINANKDLKEEIYAILQYNDKFDATRTNNIGVTFIPAEDIIHCYFAFDEHTHRGISDLQKSLIPAMLYILLYLTDIIGKITRSTDKRIYYVKQNVETNVARTMMNVVQQIKKGNMGMRQIESMNNILNIVGKYNDYIIPLGQSGDPPVQFEVMQGQDIQTPTDIMEKMEEAAVNATGVPFEFVNSTMQQDFAIRFSMSNTRFLKSIYTRQRDTEKFFSKIYTKIYNYEFNENNSLIEIILPPPTYLVMTNNAQLIDNIIGLTDKIIDTELVDESDEVKNEFKKLYTRSYLGTYIDFSAVERLRETAKVNVESKKNPNTEDGGGDDNMDDYL